MMRIKYVFIVAFIFMLYCCVSGQDSQFIKVEQTKAFKEKIKEASSKQSNIQSDFAQEKAMEYLNVAIKSSGKFWYAKPNKVRWEYIVPYDYIIIMNNGKLTTVSGNNKNDIDLSGNEVFKQINNLMSGMVTGNLFDSLDYKTDIYENDVQYLIKLEPIDNFIAEIIPYIEIYIDKEKAVASKIKLYESDSNYTIISFTNIRINESLKKDIFVN